VVSEQIQQWIVEFINARNLQGDAAKALLALGTIALGLLLLFWAYRSAGGFGPILSQPSAFAPGQPKSGQFLLFFFPALTGMIGFWATLSLNIPDFSRYAVSQRDQILGQALGLPATMALYSFIGVAVTSATTIIYGQTIWDPVDLLTRFNNRAVLIVAMISLCIATLATNIAANVVSPANDFSHLSPRHISFRMGGLITGLIGVLMMPWKLVADPNHYIFVWLIAYSALLGPIGGILIADYFVYRRRKLNLPALYQANGEYRFTNGFSMVALIALVLAVLPSLPGYSRHGPVARVPTATRSGPCGHQALSVDCLHIRESRRNAQVPQDCTAPVLLVISV